MKFISIAVAALALFLIAAKPEEKPLLGSWKLVSYQDQDANHHSVFPYGRSPAGLLIYGDTGHMAIQIMKTPPPAVSSDDWDGFSEQEKLALYDGYAAYFGRYEVDEALHLVTHIAEADLSRLYIGRREQRHYQIDGDRLTLTETWTQSGKKWSGVRVFQRVR